MSRVYDEGDQREVLEILLNGGADTSKLDDEARTKMEDIIAWEVGSSESSIVDSIDPDDSENPLVKI